MNDTSQQSIVNSDNASLKSTFYEQLVEHIFVSEILQEVWFNFGKTVEVLRAEVDASGYDLVLECNGIIRHVQLKTSECQGKTVNQKINIALAKKPGGCVVWLVRSEDRRACRVRLSYLFFGGKPGEPLPSLVEFKIAKHTKANAKGVKKERPAIRCVPKSRFESVSSVRGLAALLFGLTDSASQHEAKQPEVASVHVSEGVYV